MPGSEVMSFSPAAVVFDCDGLLVDSQSCWHDAYATVSREAGAETLERLELRAWFHAVVSAEETAAAKPAPDVYLEACRRLGAPPSESIALEDSAIGAAAAKAAGLTVVVVG